MDTRAAISTHAVITCELGTLNNGANATVVIVGRPGRVGIIGNTALVRSAEPDPNHADNMDSEQTTVITPLGRSRQTRK
jgi:uncharacterized protein DUF11